MRDNGHFLHTVVQNRANKEVSMGIQRNMKGLGVYYISSLNDLIVNWNLNK
jgi:hypothetical protein